MYGERETLNVLHTQLLPPLSFALCITSPAPHTALSNVPARWWEKLARDGAFPWSVCFQENTKGFIGMSPTTKRDCACFQLIYL